MVAGIQGNGIACFIFCDNVVRSNCVSHVLISSYIYRFVLMERRDNQNESTIITTASVCDVADASRRVARASRMTEHPYGQGECVSTQASRQLRPLPALRGARWRQRTGGPALQGPSRHPPSLTRRPTSRNSVLLLASRQA